MRCSPCGRRKGRFVELATGGFVVAEHVGTRDAPAADFVDVAVSFLGTPYLWGGRTSLGIDCSGLVQIAMEAAGIACPRDADMQAAEQGKPLDLKGGEKLARGDLVFWDGHVGIMASDTRSRACKRPSHDCGGRTAGRG